MSLALLVLCLLLSACAQAPDPARELLCRQALPAINPDGTSILVTRSSTESGGRIVRVDYLARREGDVQRPRLLRCLFAPGAAGESPTTLAAAETEQGPISSASLYFLRRFWLETQEAVAATPPAPRGTAIAGRAPESLAYPLQQAVAALPMISITGLFAIAFALVYGLVGRIVLSFGEFAAIAAALTASGTIAAVGVGAAGAAPAVIAAASVGAIAATGLAGWLSARALERPLGRGSGQATLVATIGLAIVLSEGLRLLQGTTNRWAPPIASPPIPLVVAGGDTVTMTPVGMIVTGLALLAAAALFAGIRYTVLGRYWRAVADDPVAAELCGVSRRRALAFAFTGATALAGLAGVLMTVQFGGIGFAGGAALGLKALVGAVVGGIGSLGGAFLGGLLVGAFEAIWSAAMPIEYRDAATYAILAAVIIFRPTGLFGRPEADRHYRDRP